MNNVKDKSEQPDLFPWNVIAHGSWIFTIIFFLFFYSLAEEALLTPFFSIGLLLSIIGLFGALKHHRKHLLISSTIGFFLNGSLILLWLLIAQPITRGLKSEYCTIQIINATRHFVEETKGQWPKSWSDIGFSEKYSRWTEMNFNINPSSATKEEVLFAIQPRYGESPYFNDPKEKCLFLYEELVRYREKNTAHGGGIGDIPRK